MNVLQVNFAFNPALTDPDELLDRYATLTGWSEALLEAGAGQVRVYQRFHQDRILTRNGVEYRFGKAWPLTADEARTIEVAHVNGLGFPARTRWLRARLPSRMALVVQDHASGLPPPSTAGRAIRRWGFRGVDTFLFTSARLADPWRAASIIRRRQLVHEVLEASTAVRPMARDTAREASGIAGSPALLWVGRLNANKDPMTVLAGFERIAVPYPEASLTMVFGSDELLPQVQAKVMASSALAGRVRLVGYVPPAELPAYYSAADIFVLGSHHEGSGYALIEACACGAVPVVTSIPSFRVITRDGAHGALWAPGDAIGLSHALSETAGRDLAALRADVTRHFASELSWKAVGRRALDIYAEVHARRLGSS